MAQQHYRTLFKKALLQFITEPDPYLAMLKWVMTEMMRIEAEAKVGAAKGKHSKERTTHFSGGRARRVDTRMGTVYLVVPKVRKGGYVPFFISERDGDPSKRSLQLFRKLSSTGSRPGRSSGWPGLWASRTSPLPRSRSSIKNSRTSSRTSSRDLLPGSWSKMDARFLC